MSYIFKCKDDDCGSDDVYIKHDKGNVGLFCVKCNRYIKWLGKNEVRQAEEYIARKNSLKKQVIEVDGYRIEITPHDITLFHNGAAIVQRKIDQSLFVGLR